MRLAEFSLLIIATVVGVVAGPALASKYNAARGLFWTSALLFCSLGVVWSATAEDNSPTERIVVPLVIGGIALAAVWWQKRRMRSLWDIMIACGTNLVPTFLRKVMIQDRDASRSKRGSA